MSLSWKAHKRAQKNVDTDWIKKHRENYFEYKLRSSGSDAANCRNTSVAT